MMPRKDKGSGMVKKLPTKSEVKETTKKLVQVSEVIEKINTASVKQAQDVYSNTNEIVNDSVFKHSKPISPSGKSIVLDGELSFS